VIANTVADELAPLVNVSEGPITPEQRFRLIEGAKVSVASADARRSA
jgi:hypothetical protein